MPKWMLTSSQLRVSLILDESFPSVDLFHRWNASPTSMQSNRLRSYGRDSRSSCVQEAIRHQ